MPPLSFAKAQHFYSSSATLRFAKWHSTNLKWHFCHRKVPLYKKQVTMRLSTTATRHFTSDTREFSTAHCITVDNSFNSLIYTLYISTNRCLHVDIWLYAHGLYTHLSTIQVVSCTQAWHFICNKDSVWLSETLRKLSVRRILKKKKVYTGICQMHTAHL